MTLYALPALSIVTETTTDARGSTLREAIVCKALTMAEAATNGSRATCGKAAGGPTALERGVGWQGVDEGGGRTQRIAGHRRKRRVGADALDDDVESIRCRQQRAD